MIQKIDRGVALGVLAAPASKSFSQRALAAAMLAEGDTTLTSMGLCADTEAVMEVVKSLGGEITKEGESYLVKGGLKRDVDLTINIGESGLATRLFAPIATLVKGEVTIEGRGSILTRPMTLIEEPLKALGAEMSSRDGYLPLQIKGLARGGEIEMDASLSSQFLSGLLMALPVAQGDSVINVTKLNSRPYIDMTLMTLDAFGIAVENDNYQRFTIKGGQQYRATNYNIEGDWSGASTLLVAGATTRGSVTITNLNPHSPQADRAILDALIASGAEVIVGDDEVTVSKGKLKGFAFDATDCPDLFPALVVLAAHCSGKSYLKGVGRLKHKESDRATVLQEMLGEFGIEATFDDDVMVVSPSKITAPESVDSRNDHRIAMAAAVMALSCSQEVTIERAEAVEKSYPQYWEDINSLILR